MTTATFDDDKTSVLDRPAWSVLALDWEKALYAVLIIAAFVTRFYDVGARVMSHDESLHTQYSWYLYKNGNYQHSPMMHGPLKFHLTAFTYWLLGDDDFTSRLATSLMGVAAVGLCYFFRKWLGRTGALVAALLLLISPYQLYYARYIRDEPYVMVWGMLIALMIFNYMESRAPKFLYGLAAVSALFYATMESSFIYVAIAMFFLGLFFLYELLVLQWPRPEMRTAFWGLIAVAGVLAAVGVGLFFMRDRLGISPLDGGQVQAPAEPGRLTPEGGPISAMEGYADLAWLGALIAGAFALWVVVRAFGQERFRQFAAIDLIAVLGLFVLPQLAALPVRGLGFNPVNYNPPPMTGFDVGAFFTSDAGVTVLVTVVLVIVSLGLGALWNLRVFLICAAIFYGIYIPLFTTFFTNGAGLATGMIGSLGYWLEQHGVRRGSQPWYYYAVINLPLYEFLPALGALFAGGLGLYRLFNRPPVAPPADEAQTGPKFPGLLYIGWWSVLAFGAFSVAGEKMPWLTTHICLPLILLSGWAIGQVIDSINWSHFREQRAWIVALLLPLTLVAILGGIGQLLGNGAPLTGERSEIQTAAAIGGFVAALVVVVIGAAGLYRWGAPLGWGNVARLATLTVFGLLALVTARTAYIATFINYDYANEFLVYAHGARGVKTVMDQIEDISERTTDGLGLRVAYDSPVAWPMTWYMRNYKNQVFYGDTPSRAQLQDVPVVIASDKNASRVETLLGDSYYKFDYIRMVWPMQDYFPTDKSIGERILTSLGDARMRQALWNIWWARDYTLYQELTAETNPGRSFDLAQWPMADRMKMYVRKDIAAQIWSFGVGPTQLAVEVEKDPYLEARQTIAANFIFGVQGQGDGQFNAPRGIAIGPDGSVYVADTFNHRIQKYDAEGQYVLTFGRFGDLSKGTGSEGGTFNEPWGIGVGPDGSVYVADTWNYRVQKFDAEGRFVRMWGKFGQDGAFDSFYGPRDIAVDAQGNVYVTDTGNKRVVVFDPNGLGLTSIGSEGFEPGLFDEPVGLAVAADGSLYVADTWNQRIQRFRPQGVDGEYLFDTEIKVKAWQGTSVENKPFITTDTQGRIYVTDPEGFRVLVFNEAGEFLTTWGDPGADNTTFSTISGLEVDAAGNVYVVDSGNHRVMRFPPLP
jgi:predicted membrane-bound mannosyltransferase/DNA-binding beta-propeller fold protein YncE